jgi:uncharacterized protein
MTLIIIGLFSGIISGMGIGGGTILIPSIILFTSLNQQQAQGINLVVFIPISIVALITHYLNKNINFKVVLPLIATGVLGALVGSMMAINIPSDTLKLLFALFLFSMGIYEILKKAKK